MQIILVRHAQSLCNLKHCFPSRSEDDALTPEGHEQAKALANTLSALVPKSFQLISSPALRAVQTAEAFAKDRHIIKLEASLQEIDAGDWQGCAVDTIKQAYPDWWRARKSFPLETRFPGGENLLDVRARLGRVEQLLARYEQQGREAVLIFSHSNVLSVLLATLLGWDLQPSWIAKRGYHSNAAFSVLSYSEQGQEVTLWQMP